MYFNAALHRKCTALCQASFIDADATGEGGGARGRRVSRQRLQKPCPFQRAVFGFKGRLLKGPLNWGRAATAKPSALRQLGLDGRKITSPSTSRLRCPGDPYAGFGGRLRKMNGAVSPRRSWST